MYSIISGCLSWKKKIWKERNFNFKERWIESNQQKVIIVGANIIVNEIKKAKLTSNEHIQ